MNTDIQQTRAWRFYWAITSWPLLVLILSLLPLAAGLAALPRITRDMRAEAFFPQDHPAMVYRDKVREIFGLSEPVVIAVIHDGSHGVFNPDTLRLIDWLSGAISDLPGVDAEGVRSLATENDIIGTEEGMLVEEFFDDPPTTQAEADAVRRAVMDFELYVDSLVSRDGKATLILAELVDEDQGEEVYEQVLDVVGRAPTKGEEIYIAGNGPATARVGAYTDADAQRLTPLTALVVTTILFIAYRTLRGVVLPNLLAIGAVILALGTMSGVGVPFYVVTNSLAPLLLAIAVADGIHVLGQYYEELAARPDQSSRELTVRAMVHMWRPVTVTSLTDMAGFLAIAAASFMPPMRAYGVFASIGVLGALLLSLVMLPAALTLLRPKPSASFRAHGNPSRPLRVDRFGACMGALGHRAAQHPRGVLAVAGAVAIVSALGALRLEVNDCRVCHFNTSEPIYQADAEINDRLGGTSLLDIAVETSEPGDLFRPEHLRRIEALQRYLETLPHVVSTTSIVDYVKQMNRSVNEDRAEMYRIPESADLVAQYFLLYSVSGSPTDFEEVVDYEYRLANVRAAMNSGLFSDAAVVVEATGKYIRERFNAPGIQASLAGDVNVTYYWIGGLAASHFRGVALALVVIWLMASFGFGSAVAGTLAVVPVSIAVLLIYAVMGFAGIWLGLVTTISTAIAIGIGVDFAIHTIDRLIALVRDGGRRLEEAMAMLFPSTGRALLFSFAALFLGFGVMTTSYVPGLVHFGMLVSVGVGAAFIASFTVLPALILVFRPAFLEAERSKRPTSTIKRTASMLLVMGFVAAPAAQTGAEEPDWPTGDEIARRINARDDGEHAMRRIVMELIDRRGKKRVRETFGYRKYYGDEKRTVLFYEKPKNLAGTAFLTFDYPEPDREDDQWLYLPALRKVRRISASDRGDYFLGTDFTYEDMKKEGKVTLPDYHFKTIGVEAVDAHRCYVVEGTPVSAAIAKELGYGRLLLYVDPDIWMPRKAEFWDVKKKPLKTLYTRQIEEVDGIWTATHFEAVNQKTGHRTIFRSSDVDYHTPVQDDVFTQRALRRGR